MNIKRATKYLNRAALLGFTACALLLPPTLRAATYKVGDIVGDFTLHARTSFTNGLGRILHPGDPVSLHDYEGKILFLEFFYVW